MTEKKRKIIFGSGLAALLIFGFAARGYAFGITPNRVEMAVAPGQSYEGQFEISNTGNIDPVRIVVGVKDWEMDETGGVNMFDPPEGSAFKADWFKLDKNNFIIPGNSVKQIHYTVSVPAEYKGEYRKYLVFRCGAVEEEKGSLGFATQISSPFYVVAKGTEIYKAEIKELKIDNVAPVLIEIAVENSGNVHIRPTGEMVIRKKDEEKPLLKLSVNTPGPGWPVLPGKVFRFSMQDPMKLGPGDYVLAAAFGYNEGPNFSRQMEFSVDNEGKIVTK